MKKNLLTTGLRLTAIAAAVALGGCAFNVDRVTTEKSGQINSAGLSAASIDISGYSGNISVNGTLDTIIKATATVSELATKGTTGGPAADKLTVSVTNDSGVGTVGFSYAENQDLWELLRLESVALDCNNMLGVSAKTSSGNITLAGIYGPVTLKTTSGNITADVVSGCDISVESGNIEVTLNPDADLKLATLTTTSGNIKVKVPSDLKANLELSTKSGNIDCPDNDKARLNGGSASVVIKCTTSSGNIKIVEYQVLTL
jgi:DUF4097 and DUF4098 domain-containing protein YvlB